MKKIILKTVSVTLVLFFMNSCKKDNVNPGITASTVEEVNIEDVINRIKKSDDLKSLQESFSKKSIEGLYNEAGVDWDNPIALMSADSSEGLAFRVYDIVNPTEFLGNLIAMSDDISNPNDSSLKVVFESHDKLHSSIPEMSYYHRNLESKMTLIGEIMNNGDIQVENVILPNDLPNVSPWFKCTTDCVKIAADACASDGECVLLCAIAGGYCAGAIIVSCGGHCLGK